MESVWDKAWRQARIRFPYLFWRKAWQLQKKLWKKSHLWGEIHQNLNILSLNIPPEELEVDDVLISYFWRGVTCPVNRLPWTWQSAGASVVATLLSQGKGQLDRWVTWNDVRSPKWPWNDRKEQVEVVVVSSPKFINTTYHWCGKLSTQLVEKCFRDSNACPSFFPVKQTRPWRLRRAWGRWILWCLRNGPMPPAEFFLKWPTQKI